MKGLFHHKGMAKKKGWVAVRNKDGWLKEKRMSGYKKQGWEAIRNKDGWL
jgi:hypothetical protein